jgi:IS66 Orf2 like protein/IS66 C-terminal element/Transposase IS66 family
LRALAACARGALLDCYGGGDPHRGAPRFEHGERRVAGIGGTRVRVAAARAHEVTRIERCGLAVEPLDMRAEVDTALARVVSVFGEARSHHAYLFMNRRANRVKVFVHDGFGLWHAVCSKGTSSGRARILGHAWSGDLPVDNNWLENRIRPVALGRANSLFAGSLRAGQRAAVIMSLIQSAKLNRYLKDVLERLPTQPASRIDELLPHGWQPRPPTH